MARATNTQFAVAVHVLTYLAGVSDGRVVTSEELASSANANPVYVRRVLAPMRTAGLVHARRGIHGGWELNASPARITLDRVWLLLQGQEPVLGLHEPDPGCATGRRVQSGLMALDRTVTDSILVALRGVTVRDVAEGAVLAGSTGDRSGAFTTER